MENFIFLQCILSEIDPSNNAYKEVLYYKE